MARTPIVATLTTLFAFIYSSVVEGGHRLLLAVMASERLLATAPHTGPDNTGDRLWRERMFRSVRSRAGAADAPAGRG